jgi:hypothetical protein
MPHASPSLPACGGQAKGADFDFASLNLPPPFQSIQTTQASCPASVFRVGGAPPVLAIFLPFSPALTGWAKR